MISHSASLTNSLAISSAYPDPMVLKGFLRTLPQSALAETTQRTLLSYLQQALVARAGARVGEALALYVVIRPAVRTSAEVKPENTRRASFHFLYSRSLVVVDLTASRCAPSPDHELMDRSSFQLGLQQGRARITIADPLKVLRMGVGLLLFRDHT